jgi:uncharacterized hydantoinase/oxoprolinase family protein
MRVLGLDVGNAKLKACLIDFQGSLAASEIAWRSLPLPFSADRPADFRSGLPMNILLFCLAHETELAQLEAVVVCSSHSYSWTYFHESIDALVEILSTIFETAPVFLVAADEKLYPLEAVRALSPAQKYRFVLTNWVGSASLARRQIRNGLSIDIGTTTLDVIPIVEGRVDPAGTADPDANLRFRYQQQRIHWYGLTIVPLHMLADQVEISSGRFQVVPRQYRTDLIFALLPAADPELLEAHAYGGIFPTPERARAQLCQFVGLDPWLVSEAEILEIRDFLYQRLCQRVSAAITAVTNSCFGGVRPDLEVAIYAPGAEMLAIPALEAAGFQPANFRQLELKRADKLWSASSVFAMALLGLEHRLGREVSL